MNQCQLLIRIIYYFLINILCVFFRLITQLCSNASILYIESLLLYLINE